MYPNDPDHPPVPQQLGFFHKLGYSTAEVQTVQQQFGPNVDTDKVLGELVKIGASREAKQGPVTAMLVPNGDVIVSTLQSREESGEVDDALRPIVIDGSNVAMSHGNNEVFSCLGIQLTVNFFLDRGHTDVTVFVPSWRKEQPRPDVPITDQHILRDLERRKILVFTPSRRVAGKRVVCNDDWFIVKLAYESDGVIVSNDMYRDLQGKEPQWKRFIEERLLMYSFVNNKFMLPDDPLGRHGPTLENFLRMFPKTLKRQPCPYGKKCTYGIKCKFLHPERSKQSNRSVADECQENAKHPSIAHKQSTCHSGSVPGQSLLLVEDMAKRLTLRNVIGSIKKDHENEHVAQVKVSHRSTKKATRKERSSPHSSSDPISVRHSCSQEPLDSGLGSIDCRPMEAPRSDHQYGHAHSKRQPYCPPRGPSCSCCLHGPSSRQTTPAFQHHKQQYSHGPVSSHSYGMTPYSPPRYTSCGAYPVSMHAYSQPVDFQHNSAQSSQQQHWSDPCGTLSPVDCRPPLEHSSREPPGETRQSRNQDKKRDVVRKKLLGIFSASLVDMAMDMFPHLMDPQMLVAEILMLQSQNRWLR